VETFEVPLRPFLVFLVVLARIGGLVTFAPFWSHRAATAKIRVVLALFLALIITPVVLPKIATPPEDIPSLTLVLIGELIIGCALGFIGKIVFVAFETAAHFVGSQMGFSLAGTIDPSTQAQTAAFGTVAQMLALMILLAADGHHWFLFAAVKSFSTTAPGTLEISAQTAQIFVRLFGDALMIGFALAAPMIIVLLVTEFALEIFGRAAPQFQVFILGFPIKIAVGLWIIGASLFFMPAVFRNIFGNIVQGLAQILNSL
jgi:flagellar biosynthetic protein FliR